MAVYVRSEEAHDGEALPFELALALVTLYQGNDERHQAPEFHNNIDRLLDRLTRRDNVVHNRDTSALPQQVRAIVHVCLADARARAVALRRRPTDERRERHASLDVGT